MTGKPANGGGWADTDFHGKRLCSCSHVTLSKRLGALIP